MEKEPQPDSLTDVTVKQYAPSEVYSTEPPPAYHKPQSSAVQVARIAAVTVVAVSVVLGAFILAAAYVNANASCAHLEQELEMLQRADNYLPQQPEALVQEEPIEHRQLKEHQTHAETKMDPQQEHHKDVENNIDNQDSSETEEDSEEDEDDRTPIHIKLPLTLDFDELAGALMEKNQRSRMNCVVEKKKAEEVVDHQPKTLRLPFGLNLTTDPRYEHVTGERMAIFCESGDDQRQVPQQEETMMIQPVIVPLPDPAQFQRQAPPAMPPMHPQHPMMPPQMMPHPQMMRHPQMQIRPDIHMIPENHLRPEMQQEQHEPQEPHIEQIRAHTIIVQRPMPQMPGQMIHPLMQHIAQQIIAQHEMGQQNEIQQQANVHQAMPHHIPIPEEVLSQINRLPNQEVTVSVSEHDAEQVPQDDVRLVQHPRESAHQMNGRQTYARGLPVHIPVPMMQKVQQPEPEQEQSRPHYVQPRSVRSVDKLLHREKRVKRCSCNCAC